MGEASGFVIAIVASITGVFIFELTQYVVFTQMLRNATIGYYEVKGLHIEIKEIAEDHVIIFLKEDQADCDLKETESCYSSCYQITVTDIKKGEVDIEVREDIICRMKVAVDDLRANLPTSKFLMML